MEEEQEGGNIKIGICSSEDDIFECSFPNWGPLFSKIPNCIPFSIVPLDEKFLDYLKEDVVKFPKSVDQFHGSEDVDTFPEVEKKVQEFINFHKEGVFVKMNWSAPKDCRWVFFEPDLRCKSLKDIWMLLKSSDFLMHDIDRSKKIQKCLVLKKWIRIDFSTEFRCFVQKNKLVGISQRDISKYFPFLKTMKQQIWNTVSQFWRENIMKTFKISDYTFDIFWDVKDKSHTNNIVLIDFNVFGQPTHPLLFYDWRYFSRESEEIRESIEVKVIESSEDQRLKPTPVTGLPADVSDPYTFKEMHKEFEKFEKRE